MFIKEWFDRIKRKQKDDLYSRGYNWAAGVLLQSKGEQSPGEIGKDKHTFDEFDLGVQHAEFDWWQL